MDNDWAVISDLDLKQRHIDLLQILLEEELTNFTFEGLKRRLKIHQETLSRILNRLTDQELLKKTNRDYALTSKAKELLKSHFSDSNNPALPLLQTFLPPHIPLEKLISALKGKWFGALRWLGHSVTNENVILKWITNDGGNIISAHLSQGKLHIEAKTISENDLNTALNASHQLMGYITILISKTEHN